jgi:hypothetical protein
MQHSLQIKGRAADDLEHVGGGGLLLQRLPQLTEQPTIFDRDDSLVGKAREQVDLLLGERPHLLAVDGDRTDQLILFEHRHREHRSSARHFCEHHQRRFALGISLLRLDVGHVYQLLRRGHPDERILAPGVDHRVAPPQLLPCRGRVVERNASERVALVQQQIAEFRLADPSRLLHDGLEHRLQLPGRA